MRNTLFIVLGFIWFADVAWMAAIAPVGQTLWLFSLLFGAGHILMILMVRWFPKNIGASGAFTVIFIVGLLARLIFLAYPAGNDIFRYIWEGYVQTQGFNPYRHAPDSSVLVELARGQLAPIWRQINHPELTAAYPPFSMLLLRVLAVFNPHPFVFKIVLIGFDLGVMITIWLIMDKRGVAPSRLLLYAANPLILVYIAGEGHLDVVQVFFVCLAVYFIVCKKYDTIGFIMLGMAIVTKYFALVAFPFLVRDENRFKSLAVLIPLVLYLPFADAGSDIFKSLGIFSTHYNYNDSLTVLTRFMFGESHLWITAILLTLCLVWVYMVVRDTIRSIYLALGCLLLFLPTLHPWYLILLTPFLTLFPSRAWLYLHAAVLFTFPAAAIEYQTGSFQEIHWLKLLEYLPFFGLLTWGVFRNGYVFKEKFRGRVARIAVIIPTLNEAELIGPCLQALKNRTGLKEVIVADGGSTDETRNIALKAGAIVVASPKGRGLQIDKGLKKATADVIVILHADCEAQKGVFERILKTLNVNRYAVGGAVGMQFRQKNLQMHIVAALNNLRARLTGISFGDQAQFFRLQALNAIGGFPALMLMEDVELSLRLKEVGSLVFLSHGIMVSDRHWQGRQFTYKLRKVLRLFPRYLIARRFRRKDRIYRKYYDAYYPDNRGF